MIFKCDPSSYAGTYFAASPFSLAANVIGKKVLSDPVKHMYTISEGAFGAFILTMKKDPPLQFKVRQCYMYYLMLSI